MRMRGVKVLDSVSLSRQLDWLIVPAHQCRDEHDEQRLIAAHFRVPHEPWEPRQAFVEPVIVLRSRRRVLFRQESGLEI